MSKKYSPKKFGMMYASYVAAMIDERQDGYDDGYEDGISQGISQGVTNAREKMAIAMLADGVDPISVAKWSNLPLERIK